MHLLINECVISDEKVRIFIIGLMIHLSLGFVYLAACLAW